MSHTSLVDYYKTIQSLTFHHKYTISDLENLYPFERDIYVDLLLSYLQEEEEKIRND